MNAKDKASQVEVQEQAVIVLGAASIETKGPPGGGEPIGLTIGLGISEE